jgi:hypothetical protein
MRQPASLRQSQRRSLAAKPSSEIYAIRLSQSTDNAKIAALFSGRTRSQVSSRALPTP